MEVETLEIFVDVYRAGSFSRVARANAVTPSSVSRAISSLEKELSSRLFQRSTRRLAPTEAGARFFQRVVPVLEELTRARLDLQDDSARGHLRVSSSVAYGQTCIVPRLGTFTRAYPEVELELVMNDRRVDVISERIDLAIRHGSLADSTLVARRLCAVDYRLVASPTYLSEAPDLESPEDILEHRCITFALEAFRTWRFRQEDEVRAVEPVKRLTLSGALGVRACAVDGVGLAILPDWAIRDELAAGTLVSLLPEWRAAGSTFDSSLWLVYPSRAYVPAKVRVFEEFVFSSPEQRI